MKKPILIIALSAIAVCGLSIGCANNADKLAEANQETKDAKEELANAQVDAAVSAQRAATAEEWKLFRLESDVKIQKREAEIAALKQSLRKTGGESDEINAEKILELEQRNKDLNAKINNYEASQSDWATFKREYDYDMESMSKAIQDLGTNNTK
ncbi:MAG: hypothetical protein V4561_01750 [Bacteroidota bacterium]